MIYIKSIEIGGLKCFGKKQKIDFTHKDKIAQWTIILGDNGTGKTTLLKSIVSLLPMPADFLSIKNRQEYSFKPSYFSTWSTDWHIESNRKSSKPTIRLELSDSSSFEYESLQSKWLSIDRDIDQSNPKFLSPIYCFAYGANRKVSPNSLSGNKILEASRTLFREDELLPNSEEFFLQLDYESAKSRRGSDEINKVKDLLIKILPEGVQNIRVSKRGHLQREVQVQTHYGWVGINDLSMGYKTTIAWLIDFAYKMIYFHNTSAKPFEEPAILIIDEIDLHMHPSWQYEIINKLTELFPKTQFIATAHSPLIAQAALNSNLVLLRRNGKQVDVVNEPDIIKTWRIDQILTSDLFGLENSRGKEVQNIIDEKTKLLSKHKLTKNEEARLNILKNKLGEIPVYDTEIERKTFSAIDRIAEILKRND